MRRRFYLSRPELVRSASVREPLKLLDQWLHKWIKFCIEKRWDAVAGLVSTIASAITKKASGIDANIDAGLRDLLKTDVAQRNYNQFARALLSRSQAISPRCLVFLALSYS